MSHRADLSPAPRDQPLSNRMKRRANIPELFWPTTIGKIPDTARHKKAVLDYVATMHETETKGLGLILAGAYGSGKSALACCLLMEAMRRGPVRCYYVPAADIPSMAIEKPMSPSGESVWELLCGRAQFLVIDDMGDGRATDWTSNSFTRVLNARRNNIRPTYITTNKSLEGSEQNPGLFNLIPRLKQLGGSAYEILMTDDRLQWRSPLELPDQADN